MAWLTAVTAKHATLTSTTADLVTFSGVGKKTVRVSNKDASTALYFNINSATVPTSAADDTFYVAAGSSVSISAGGDVLTVRVVGNGNAYGVEIA